MKLVKYKFVLLDLSGKVFGNQPSILWQQPRLYQLKSIFCFTQRAISDLKSPLSIHNSPKRMLIWAFVDSTTESLPFPQTVAKYLVEPMIIHLDAQHIFKVPLWMTLLRKWEGFEEDGEVESTKNLSPHIDNNHTGRICLMELFWNTGGHWRLQLPAGLDCELRQF